MTDDLDRRIAGLFNTPLPPPDRAFGSRIVSLVEYDLAVRNARRRASAQVGREALALAAVLVTFVLLARHAPTAISFGDYVPLGSPIIFGLAMLLAWGLVAACSPDRLRSR
jgi:hypothetical protein